MHWVCLWFKDTRLHSSLLFTDRKFIVLSGQHTTKALMTLRKEWIQERGDAKLPECLRHLRADILFHDVALEHRKLVAGTEQFKQEGFSHIPLSSWATSVLENKPVPGYSIRPTIVKAVACCGYRRPEDSVC